MGCSERLECARRSDGGAGVASGTAKAWRVEGERSEGSVREGVEGAREALSPTVLVRCEGVPAWVSDVWPMADLIRLGTWLMRKLLTGRGARARPQGGPVNGSLLAAMSTRQW